MSPPTQTTPTPSDAESLRRIQTTSRRRRTVLSRILTGEDPDTNQPALESSEQPAMRGKETP